MAREEGYSRCQCTVKGCTVKSFEKPGTEGWYKYQDCEYQDANGNIRTVLMCQGHAQQFKAIKEAHDAEFADFINNGKLPYSVKGE